MNLLSKPVLATLCLIVAIPAICIGNGATMGVKGRLLTPIQNDNIKLVYEKLILKSDVYSRDGVVYSDCWYYLKNLKDSTQRITLGFICDDTIYCDATAEIEGKLLNRKYNLVESAWKKKHLREERDVFAEWKITFKPKELKKVHIKQKLLFSMGDAALEEYLSCSTNRFDYILSLATLWAEIPDSMNILFDFGANFNVTDVQWLACNDYSIKPSNFKWINNHLVQWQLKNIKPDSNITVIFNNYHKIPSKEWMFYETGFQMYIYDIANYNGDKKLYNDSDMILRKADFDTLELKKMTVRYNDHKSIQKLFVQFRRNIIYAVHGYVFKNKLWSDYFGRCDWYKPNPAFSDSDLTAIEKKNVQFIREYEKAIGINNEE